MARKTLHPFQREAVDKAVAELKKADRAKVIMPCGTGKTLVGIETLKRLKPKRAIIFTPWLSLVSQLLRSYADEEAMKSALVVCSDRRAADCAREKLNIERVTTDPEEIANELKKQSATIFCTYKSSQRVAEAYEIAGTPQLDFGVFDEAHRVASKSELYTTALDDKLIPIRKRMFMTATPRVASDRDKQSGEFIACMNNETLFGKEAFYMSFSDAIAGEHLTDYQVAIFAVKESEVRAMIESDEDIAGVAKRIAIAKAAVQYDLKKMLVYHNSNAAMKRFADTDFREAFKLCSRRPLWSKSISGTDNAEKRQVVFDDFASRSGSEFAVISSNRTMQEGFDLAVTESVSMLQPKRSPIDIVQIVGRAIRKSPDKKLATIVLPVFIPENAENDLDPFIESSEFDIVWDVIAALRSHDERIEGWISDSVRGKPSKLPINIVVNAGLPVGVSQKMADCISSRLLAVERKKRTVLTKELVWQWMQEYQATHGTWPKPTTKGEGPNGWSWSAIDVKSRYLLGFSLADLRILFTFDFSPRKRRHKDSKIPKAATAIHAWSR